MLHFVVVVRKKSALAAERRVWDMVDGSKNSWLEITLTALATGLGEVAMARNKARSGDPDRPLARNKARSVVAACQKQSEASGDPAGSPVAAGSRPPSQKQRP